MAPHRETCDAAANGRVTIVMWLNVGHGGTVTARGGGLGGEGLLEQAGHSEGLNGTVCACLCVRFLQADKDGVQKWTCMTNVRVRQCGS